jgi:hypothetical protein
MFKSRDARNTHDMTELDEGSGSAVQPSSQTMAESKKGELLDSATTEKILETEVINSTGEKVKLGSVFEENQKTILVFIREWLSVRSPVISLSCPYDVGHFFCGV